MEVISPGPFEITNPLGAKMPAPARGHNWPKQEIIKYTVFLTYHNNVMQIYEQDYFQSWTFFRRLSLFVQTKNPNQCRIHHKKMMSDHLSINSLVSHLRATISKFQEWYSFYQSVLHNLRTSLAREKEEKQNSATVSDKIIGSSPISIEVGSQCDDKKNDNMKPTGIDYDCESEVNMRPSRPSFVPLQTQRPSFSLFTMEDQDINEDLAMIAKKGQGGTLEQEEVRECHSNFLDYMGKLGTLMKSSEIVD